MGDETITLSREEEIVNMVRRITAVLSTLDTTERAIAGRLLNELYGWYQ